MQITINGQDHTFEDNLSIEQILIKLDVAQRSGLAVALNQTVLSKNKFSETVVKNGDELEIIGATAGG